MKIRLYPNGVGQRMEDEPFVHLGPYRLVTAHEREIHTDCHEEFCNICKGGLYVCKICGLAEGALSTECCTAPCTIASDQVYKGEKDFIAGEWVKGTGEMPCATNKIMCVEDLLKPETILTVPIVDYLDIDKNVAITFFLNWAYNRCDAIDDFPHEVVMFEGRKTTVKEFITAILGR